MGVDVEKGFQETYEVIESKAKVLAELKAAGEEGRRPPARDRPRPRGRGHRLAPRRGAQATRARGPPRRVPRDHEEGRRARHRRTRASSTSTSTTRSARAACSTASSATTSRRSSGRKLAFGLSRRSRAVASRSASSSTASARSRRSFPRSTGTSASALRGARRRRRSPARLVKADGEKLEVKNGEHGRGDHAPTSRPRSTASSEVTQREQKRNAPAPYTTSKLQQDATSYLRFSTKRTMQHRAGPLRRRRSREGRRSRRSHHVHAYRLGAREPRRGRRGCASSSSTQLRRDALPEKPNVFKSQEERAGRARGDPPDVARAPAREGAKAPDRRAVQALQAHLGSLRRVADGAGRLRPDRRRHRGRAGDERRPLTRRTACARAARS